MFLIGMGGKHRGRGGGNPAIQNIVKWGADFLPELFIETLSVKGGDFNP